MRETRVIQRDNSGTGLSDPSSTVPSGVSYRERLRQGLDGLPRKRREALVLKVFQNLSYPEISAVVGAPTATVSYWVEQSLSDLQGRF